MGKKKGFRDRELTPEEWERVNAISRDADREDGFLLAWQMAACAQEDEEGDESDGNSD